MTGALPLLGFGLPVSGSWATPDTMRRTARRAEELGYASLWTFQRVLYPADGELDPPYRAVHDPVVALAYVAGHTDRIGLGTATVCAPFTAPALLAKALTSLDVLSGGRLTVGLGMGWLPEEYAAAGVPFERRGARMDEYLRCLETLWTQDPAAVRAAIAPQLACTRSPSARAGSSGRRRPWRSTHTATFIAPPGPGRKR